MLSRNIKKLYTTNARGTVILHMPKKIANKLGNEVVIDEYENKIVIYSIENLGKIKEN